MKTEYRSAFYDRISLPETLGPGAAPFVGPTGTAVTFKPWNQTISTSLVYRFNWGGAPVAASVLSSANYAAGKPRHRPGLFAA